MKMEIEELRYSEDAPAKFGLDDCAPSAEQSHRERMGMLSDSVRVSAALFPELGKNVQTVCENLHLRHNPEFYVKNDAGVQAWCISLDGEVDFAVVLSSDTVNLLDSGELSFVLGHEIGHYLFRHGYYGRPSGLSELSFMHWQRAAEVSADRAGYVCAPSEKDGISAMIKTACGLGRPHLKLHVSSYAKQAKEIMESGNRDAVHSSHPSLPLRVRALQWFGMSEPYQRWRNSGKHAPLSKEELDDKIRREFERAEGGEMQAVGNDIIRRALLWCLLDFCIADDVLTKAEQRALEICAGEKEARKAVAYVQAHGKKAVRDKCKRALKEVGGLPPADKKKFESNLRSALPESGNDANGADASEFITFVKAAIAGDDES